MCGERGEEQQIVVSSGRRGETIMQVITEENRDSKGVPGRYTIGCIGPMVVENYCTNNKSKAF